MIYSYIQKAAVLAVTLLSGCSDSTISCQRVESKYVTELCTQRSKSGTLISVYDPHALVCFYQPSQPKDCAVMPSLPLTPSIEHAANQANTTNLALLVDQTIENKYR